MIRAKGSLVIQDGVYKKVNEPEDVRFRRGIARKDSTFTPKNEPKLIANKDRNSFQVDLTCLHYASVYDEARVIETRNIIRKDKTFRRVAGKNITKDVKNFVCSLAGHDSASLLRKRLIGLQKIHKTISNETFLFNVQDP